MMKFWGIEVPSGDDGISVEVETDEEYVHVSQAALGPNAKDKERVVIQVETGDNQAVVLGTLVKGKCDQMQLDLVFETSFRLSHTGAGSVYMIGYETRPQNDDEDDDEEYEESEEDDEDESEEDEEVEPISQSVPVAINGKPAQVVKPSVAKIKAASAPLPKRPFAPAVDEDDEDDEEDEAEDILVKEDLEDDDEDDEDDEDEEEDDDVEGDEEDDDEDDEEEEKIEDVKPPPRTPVSVASKRPGEALKTPKSEKKVKVDSPAPSKKPGKKQVAAVTPAAAKTSTAAKSAAKTTKPAETPKGTPKGAANTPASGKKTGAFACDGCEKTFDKEVSLSQHKRSKHGEK